MSNLKICQPFLKEVLFRPVITGKQSANCLRPVSYTHLDVYKRQVHLVTPPFLTENFLVIELDGVDTLVLLVGG